jgi:hypothetical protein
MCVFVCVCLFVCLFVCVFIGICVPCRTAPRFYLTQDQSIVTSNLSATRNVTPLQKAVDILNGQNVGTVASSIEEWRMRSRGANVTLSVI